MPLAREPYIFILAFSGCLHSWTCQSLMAKCICVVLGCIEALMKTLQSRASPALAASRCSIVIHTPVVIPTAGRLPGYTHLCVSVIFSWYEKRHVRGLTANDWRDVQWKCASGGPKHVCALVIRKCLQLWPACFHTHWSVNLGNHTVSGDTVTPVKCQ